MKDDKMNFESQKYKHVILWTFYVRTSQSEHMHFAGVTYVTAPSKLV